MKFPVEAAVRSRRSVRTYEPRPLSAADREKIETAVNEILNIPSPFSHTKIRIQTLETSAGEKERKLGTYGIIKGAQTFLGVTVENDDMAMAATGYLFEKLVLYAAHLGLGTCWMGGTFNRSEFSAAMQIKDNELFPIISPIGYPAEKRRMTEKILRKVGKSDQRKAWEELFYENDFETPLSRASAGEYAFPLEMLRLAPSAVNKQPWRILLRDGAFHFYEAKDAQREEKAAYDIQQLDVGIAACHFHLAAEEASLPGAFQKLPAPVAEVPGNMRYLFSWVSDRKPS